MGAHYEVRTNVPGTSFRPLAGRMPLLYGNPPFSPNRKGEEEYYCGFYYKDEAVAAATLLRKGGFLAEVYNCGSGKKLPLLEEKDSKSCNTADGNCINHRACNEADRCIRPRE